MSKENQQIRSDANADAGVVTAEMRAAIERHNDECTQWEADCRAQYEAQCRKGKGG